MGVNPRAPHAMALPAQFRLALFPEFEAEVGTHVTAWSTFRKRLRGTTSSPRSASWVSDPEGMAVLGLGLAAVVETRSGHVVYGYVEPSNRCEPAGCSGLARLSKAE